MNYLPTEQTIRTKMERESVLFAKDEVQVLLSEVDDLRRKVAADRFRNQHLGAICGVVVRSSWHEPVACAYRLAHEGDHSWASLPQFYDAPNRNAISLGDGDPITGRPGWFWSADDGRPVWRGASYPASSYDGLVEPLGADADVCHNDAQSPAKRPTE